MKFGEHGFHFASSDAWNSLPSHLHCITYTADFKRKLRTKLLRQAFDQWVDYYFCLFFIILPLLADFVERHYTNFSCICICCLSIGWVACLVFSLLWNRSNWNGDTITYNGVKNVIAWCGGWEVSYFWSGWGWHETVQQSDGCRSTGKHQHSTDNALHAWTGRLQCCCCYSWQIKTRNRKNSQAAAKLAACPYSPSSVERNWGKVKGGKGSKGEGRELEEELDKTERKGEGRQGRQRMESGRRKKEG